MAKLQECELDSEPGKVAAVTYPFAFDRPEEEWTASAERGTLPSAVFDFYCAAKFFSWGDEPLFLRDSDHVLFGYLKAVVSGVREAFEEASSLVESIQVAERKQWSPVKELRGEPWEPEAGYTVRRGFKLLIAELSGVLDQLAEVVAILFFGHIAGLPIGRADFVGLLNAARSRADLGGGIVSPQIAQLEKVLTVVARHVDRDGPEADWYKLFQLYRNKLTHLGNFMLPTMGFAHASRETLHSFLPNHWPAVMEGHISIGRPGPPVHFATFFASELIHQDLIDYSLGLLRKIQVVVGDVFSVLVQSYKLFRDFEPASGVMNALNRQAVTCRFRFFEQDRDAAAEP